MQYGGQVVLKGWLHISYMFHMPSGRCWSCCAAQTNNGRHVKLPENISQNLRNNLIPQTVHKSLTDGQSRSTYSNGGYVLFDLGEIPFCFMQDITRRAYREYALQFPPLPKHPLLTHLRLLDLSAACHAVSPTVNNPSVHVHLVHFYRLVHIFCWNQRGKEVQKSYPLVRTCYWLVHIKVLKRDKI